jgi:hypothetical protein
MTARTAKWAGRCLVTSIGLFTSCLAYAQPSLDWITLGANATTIINTGQTFTDIGTTLGRPDLAGVDLTLSYSGAGLSGNKLIINSGSVDPDQWNLFNGTLSFTLSSPRKIRFLAGGSLLAGEVDAFGPTGAGGLISNHPESGLTVTDDSVGNFSGQHIITNSLEWLSNVPVTNFTHTVTAHNEGARLFILVPEPSALCLGMFCLLSFGHRARRT